MTLVRPHRMVCQQYLRFLLQECLQLLVTENPNFSQMLSVYNKLDSLYSDLSSLSSYILDCQAHTKIARLFGRLAANLKRHVTCNMPSNHNIKVGHHLLKCCAMNKT